MIVDLFGRLTYIITQQNSSIAREEYNVMLSFNNKWKTVQAFMGLIINLEKENQCLKPIKNCEYSPLKAVLY